MHFKKIFIFIALSLVIGLFGCTKEEKKVGAPKQEEITKNLVPPKSELTGQNFFVELTDLKVLTVVDTASKEIIGTPTPKVGSRSLINRKISWISKHSLSNTWMKLGSQSLINLKRKLKRFMHFGRLFSLKASPKVLWTSRSQRRLSRKSP